MARPNAVYGQGSGQSLVTHVACRGTETNIRECSKDTSSCSHAEDAGVKCSNGKPVICLFSNINSDVLD